MHADGEFKPKPLVTGTGLHMVPRPVLVTLKASRPGLGEEFLSFCHLSWMSYLRLHLRSYHGGFGIETTSPKSPVGHM